MGLPGPQSEEDIGVLVSFSPWCLGQKSTSQNHSLEPLMALALESQTLPSHGPGGGGQTPTKQNLLERNRSCQQIKSRAHALINAPFMDQRPSWPARAPSTLNGPH